MKKLAIYCLYLTLLIPSGRSEEYVNRQHFGTNLSGVADWGTSFPFGNLMKQARPWQFSRGDFARDVDEHGNLLSLPEDTEAYLTVILGNKHLPGRYILTWDGKGSFSTPRIDKTEVLVNEPNRLEVNIPEVSGGIYVHATSIDPADPPTNLRLVHESMTEAPTQFNPEFLEFLKPFGVIRFMDWMETNGSETSSWEQRPKPDFITYQTRGADGIPVEVMCDLCNQLAADAWFCMPHLADDDYVRNFAAAVKENLDPSLQIYIEYSNEVWNWNFAQSRYAKEKGETELGVNQGDGPHRAWYAKRSGEIFDIWEDVFGNRDRFIRVCAVQSSQIRVAKQTLEYENAHEHFDAIAIAPYFGFNRELAGRFKASPETTVDHILDAAENVIVEKVASMTTEHRALADKYNLDLITYEAGQHLLDRAGRQQDGTSDLAKKFIEANRASRMGDLYSLYFQTWFENGGELMVLFSSIGEPSRYGSWGMKEYLSQPDRDAPKYAATIRSIRNPALIPAENPD